MNTYDIIKYWDDFLVEQHIGSELNVIVDYFKKQNIKTLVYVDIGANSGRYHDVLSRSFKISHSVMVEASKPLYDYLLNKFTNTTYDIYNYILSDINSDTSFADIDFSYITDIKNMNLGLSKSYDSTINNKKQISAYNFFIDKILNKNIDKIDLIKIDTENRDYHILKALTNCVCQLKNKPLICFEHNYHNDMSKDEAQKILNNFCNVNGYKLIDIDNITWSSVFLWP